MIYLNKEHKGEPKYNLSLSEYELGFISAVLDSHLIREPEAAVVCKPLVRKLRKLMGITTE